jgi:hypothetical protein
MLELPKRNKSLLGLLLFFCSFFFTSFPHWIDTPPCIVGNSLLIQTPNIEGPLEGCACENNCSRRRIS